MTQEQQSQKPAAYRPTISFKGGDKCINIGKDVIRLLREPPFIGLFLSEEGDSLAIAPCSEKQKLSFAVPRDFLNRNVMFRIHSKQFVEGVLKSVGLDINKTYRLKGTFIPEHNVITFSFSEFEGLAKDRIFVLSSAEDEAEDFDEFPDDDEFPPEDE
jgi:hypothetical protein